MELFKKGAEKELDSIIRKLQMNMSNNYKDNAQDNFRQLEETFDRMQTDGSLKGRSLAKYKTIIEEYRDKLKGYSHKDQKPYWH